MNSAAQKTQSSSFVGIAIGIGISTLFFMFRFTAAAAFLVFILLCVFFRLHHSQKALRLSFTLFVAAILIPVDVYVPGWNGPLRNSTHSGPRFVRVLYGYGARFRDGRESISGGCLLGIHDTRWRLVWD